jgi:hypothetical protein
MIYKVILNRKISHSGDTNYETFMCKVPGYTMNEAAESLASVLFPETDISDLNITIKEYMHNITLAGKYAYNISRPHLLWKQSFIAGEEADKVISRYMMTLARRQEEIADKIDKINKINKIDKSHQGAKSLIQVFI